MLIEKCRDSDKGATSRILEAVKRQSCCIARKVNFVSGTESTKLELVIVKDLILYPQNYLHGSNSASSTVG